MSISPEEEIAFLEAMERNASKELALSIQIAKSAVMAHRDGKKSKTFDWMKAVSILKANNIKNADAGLIEDWANTAGMIVECGDIYKESKPRQHSIWATPGLLVEYKDGNEEMIDCWCYAEDATWDIDTVWPEAAEKEFLNKPHFVVDGLGNKIELW